MKLKIAAALVIGMTCLLAAPAYADEWKQDSKGYWYEYEGGHYVQQDLALIDNEVYYFGEDGYMRSNATAMNGLFNVTGQGNFVVANPETVQGQLAYHGIRTIAVIHRMLQISQWYPERIDRVRLVIPELERLKTAAQGIVSICDSDPSGVYAACRQPAATVLEDIATVQAIDPANVDLFSETYNNTLLGNMKPFYETVLSLIFNGAMDVTSQDTQPSQSTQSSGGTASSASSGSTASSGASQSGTGYAGMAHQDFYSIKSDYVTATPFIGYAQPFTMPNGDSCVLVTIGYTIIDHYFEHFLHNKTTGEWIRDPDRYFEIREASTIGGKQINEMKKHKSVLEAKQKALNAINHILENGNNTGTGQYISPEYLE